MEQRQQGQAKDGEITALDACEELNTDAFEPVGADRPEDLGADGVEIILEEPVAEIPHGERRAVDEMPQTLAVVHDADRGHELVTLAAQGKELRARRRAIPRLVEPIALTAHTLAAADHDTAGMPPRGAH